MVLSILAKVFGTGLGTGYIPFASGTFGSLLAVLIYWFFPGFDSLVFFIPTILACLILGIWASSLLEQYYGHDPSEVTIDEVVGQWIALLFLPKTLTVVSIAFISFRVFDILKIEPVNQLQKLPKGYGVMMDDVMAGIYANLTCHAILWMMARYEAFIQ